MAMSFIDTLMLMLTGLPFLIGPCSGREIDWCVKLIITVGHSATTIILHVKVALNKLQSGVVAERYLRNGLVPIKERTAEQWFHAGSCFDSCDDLAWSVCLGVAWHDSSCL